LSSDDGVAKADDAFGEHHAPLQYRGVPDFVQRLRHREGIAPLALEFWILNRGAIRRSGEWNRFREFAAG